MAVLNALIRNFNGGPVGLNNLSAMVGEEAETVETVCEPYLVRQGDRRGAWPLAHHDVHAEVLHRDVQQFLRRTGQAVDLVDEEHLPCVERAEPSATSR